jgi:hypothetical protein
LSQAVRSITLEKDGVFPIKKDEAGRILLVGQFDEFFKAGKNRFPSAHQWSYNYSIGPNETQWNVDNLPKFARNYDTIIACVCDKNYRCDLCVRCRNIRYGEIFRVSE